MKRIVRFLKYTFLGEIDGRTVRIVRVEAFGRKKAQEKEQELSSPVASTEKNQTILMINWILAIILVLFGSTMFIYAVFYRSEKIPDYINNGFYMILGWFGSAYTSFHRIDQK
jgi:hypothetical protein